MGTAFNNVSDEFGTNNIAVAVRKQSDIAVDNGTHFVLNRGIGKIISKRPIVPTKSFLVTAGDVIDWEMGGTPFAITPLGTSFDLFVTLPLKAQDITNFSDPGGVLTTVNSTTHGLQTGDTIKIIESRVQQYLGNHVITVVNANSFTIAVDFINADGACRWEQTRVHVDSQADSSGKTLLACIAHPFEDGDWINVVSNGGANGTFQVEQKTNDTIVIDTTFLLNVAAELDVGFGSMSFEKPTFINIFGASGKLWKLQGKPDLTSFVGLVEQQIINFELGQTSDLSMGYGLNSLFINCTNHRSLGDAVIGLDNGGNVRASAAFDTKDYKAMFECDLTLPGGSVLFHVGRAQFFASESLMNIPSTSNPLSNGVTMLGQSGDPAPGDYFKTADRARATAVSSGVVSNPMIIPVDDTTGFRVGDNVDTSESSQSNFSTSITAITKNTSITVAVNAPAHEVSDTQNTVTDNGDGTIRFRAANTEFSMTAVGDTVEVKDVVPTAYRGRYKVLAIFNGGGTNPEISVTGVKTTDLTTAGTITNDSGILVTNTTTGPSKTETDPLILSEFNKGTPNSMVEAEADFLTTGGTEITINTLGVAEKIGTTSWISNHTQRATISTAGVMTYLGKVQKDIQVNFSATIERVTGTPTLGIGIGLFRNGALISGFEYSRSFNAGKVQVNASRIVDMDPNDTMELVVINFDNTVNIDVFQANVVWNEVA